MLPLTGRIYYYGSAVLLVLLCCFTTVAHAVPVVERVSFTPRADGGGYVVRIHTSDRLQAYSEPRFVGHNQLELILFNTDLAQHCQRDNPEGPIQSYSMEMRKGHLYLEFQVDEEAWLDAAAYRDRDSQDMILGLTYRGDLPRDTAIPVRPASAQRESVESSAASPAPVLPPNDVRSRWKLDTIVIDAGHGGHDAGAVANGIREKDVVLPVALKLGQYLEDLLGVNVVYTRKSDHFVTLNNRGHIANQAGGKLFISIHANAARNRSATGAETYFLGLHKTAAARQVMERENEVVKLESNPEAYEELDEQALIVQTLAQSAYMRKSEELASFIQDQFTNRVGRKNRGVKQAGFYVLWSASMPSILVELGFVTNPTEAAFLNSETGQDYLASAIFRAVRDYKIQYEKGLDVVAQ
ncbi:MAG TPA: N-acetylmuramoyl-L-alanine amidase [Rhodothermales bacterium]|nr:N-acetylmuramoyl-L-alanine amidase [Rhodothermales bacterium]